MSQTAFHTVGVVLVECRPPLCALWLLSKVACVHHLWSFVYSCTYAYVRFASSLCCLVLPFVRVDPCFSQACGYHACKLLHRSIAVRRCPPPARSSSLRVGTLSTCTATAVCVVGHSQHTALSHNVAGFSWCCSFFLLHARCLRCSSA